MLDSHTLIQHGLAHCHLEPVFCTSHRLWLYGNIKLLEGDLAFIEKTTGPPRQSNDELALIEKEAEEIVLGGKILVCGLHNVGHRRAAVVPLRWGSPRIVVFSGGIRFHLGHDLMHEPFRVARLWRYKWDAVSDLAVSRRAPDKLPTFASHNPTVDRVIRQLTALFLI